MDERLFYSLLYTSSGEIPIYKCKAQAYNKTKVVLGKNNCISTKMIIILIQNDLKIIQQSINNHAAAGFPQQHVSFLGY